MILRSITEKTGVSRRTTMNNVLLILSLHGNPRCRGSWKCSLRFAINCREFSTGGLKTGADSGWRIMNINTVRLRGNMSIIREVSLIRKLYFTSCDFDLLRIFILWFCLEFRGGTTLWMLLGSWRNIIRLERSIADWGQWDASTVSSFKVRFIVC